MAITLAANSSGVRQAGATVSVAFASPNASGALLTLAVRCNSSRGPSAVVDSAGNTWALAADALNNGQAPRTQIWYASNAAASTNTLTVTLGDSSNALQAQAQEWAGVATVSPLLGISTNASTVTASTHTPGPISADQSTALFYVAYGFGSAFDIIGNPVGFSSVVSTLTGLAMYYKANSGSTSSENPQVSSSSLEESANVMALFAGGTVLSAKRRSGLRLLGVG